MFTVTIRWKLVITLVSAYEQIRREVNVRHFSSVFTTSGVVGACAGGVTSRMRNYGVDGGAPKSPKITRVPA